MEEKTMNKNKWNNRFVRNIVIAVLLCIVLIVVLKIASKNLSSDNDFATTETNQEEIIMMDIETPYGVLNYPSNYEEWLVYNESEQEDIFAATFSCTSSGETVEMFTVYFNNPEIGELIGYVQNGEEKVSITIQIAENIVDDENYYLMLDGVNDVIESITKLATYMEE